VFRLSTWASEVGIAGCVDIGLMGLMIYGLLVWLRRMCQASLILGGLIILGGIYLGAVRFGLVLTTAVLQAFFAIFVIVLVVIFQEELRQLFEQIAKWGLSRAWAGRRPAGRPLPRAEVQILVDSLDDLARERVGALVVLVGHDAVDRHVDGGVEVGAKLSEPLLKSIFDPHSPGHDGAVIIRRGRVERLGVRLPLTRNAEALGPRGTRHAAALGLSEQTDALALVVSEERGTISVAHKGKLEVVADQARLQQLTEVHCQTAVPELQAHPLRTLFAHDLRAKAAALGIALLLWWVLAYPSEVVSRYVTVTVESASAPSGLSIVQINPSVVEARVAGPRRLLGEVQPRDFRLQLGMTNLVRGFQMLPISEGEFSLPAGVELADFRPRQVFVLVEESSAPPGSL